MVVLIAGKETVVFVAGMFYSFPINKVSCAIGVCVTLHVNNLFHRNIIIVLAQSLVTLMHSSLLDIY